MKLLTGDCIEKLQEMDADSIDAVVCDPPYGLSFMGAGWDHGVPGKEYWQACLRVLKPGGYLMAFGGTRTYHRLVCAIEDAGFQIRDSIQWIYGQGFPKGKGQLKPAHEPITLARKPGEKIKPLGIEECRVPSNGDHKRPFQPSNNPSMFNNKPFQPSNAEGRYPPNVLLQHHEECTEEQCHEDCAVKLLGEQSGVSKSTPTTILPPAWSSAGSNPGWVRPGDKNYAPRMNKFDDEGTAARFFPQFYYCAKASRSERNKGCEEMPEKEMYEKGTEWGHMGINCPNMKAGRGVKPEVVKHQNTHPCVKPIKLLEWLVKLVSREGDTVLDCFMGSGSTGVACANTNREFIGIDINEEWVEIARRRIEHAKKAKVST